MRIGILALQGAFAEHAAMLDRLQVPHFEIRQAEDFFRSPPDGLILPGGESTTMGKLLRELGLFEPIRRRILGGMPVFGTCAGLILLAKKLANDERRHFATMDLCVERNAYGRQLGSYRAEGAFTGVGTVPMVFIRAPHIARTLSDKVQILAEVDGRIVAAREGNQLAVCFHPELTAHTGIHRYFLDMVKAAEHCGSAEAG